MKYYVIAGEASGDRQAALLCKAIRLHDGGAEITGWGGEEMEREGATITKHYRELAFMGFAEVVRHLPEIMRNFKRCREEILHFHPDGLILVDYPGFNLRMAAWAAKKGIPVYYYISPQLWAWHTSRVHGIKKAVRKMYVILPFEKEFYREYEMDVVYIGHPLAMDIPNEIRTSDPARERHIALLPGSRRHEVARLLPEMVSLAARMPDYTFTVAAVRHLPEELYNQYIGSVRNIQVMQGNMPSVLQRCEVAIVTSGTATLETALHGVPEVVVYKGSPLSYQIARRVIKVPYISLVNLIAGEKLVPELIQQECTSTNMEMALREIMEPKRKMKIEEGFRRIHAQLASGGGAETAAIDIIEDLRQHTR